MQVKSSGNFTFWCCWFECVPGSYLVSGFGEFMWLGRAQDNVTVKEDIKNLNFEFMKNKLN